MKWVKFTEDKANGGRDHNRPSGYECYRCFDVRRRNLKNVSQKKVIEGLVDHTYKNDVEEFRYQHANGDREKYQRSYRTLEPPTHSTRAMKGVFEKEFIKGKLRTLTNVLKDELPQHPEIKYLATMPEKLAFVRHVLQKTPEADPYGTWGVRYYEEDEGDYSFTAAEEDPLTCSSPRSCSHRSNESSSSACFSSVAVDVFFSLPHVKL